MRLYLECNMGASGDMLMAALYELLTDKEAFRKKMKRLGLSGVTLEYSASTKCGITGTHISVKVGGVEEKSEDVRDSEPAPSLSHSKVHNKKQKQKQRHDHSHDNYHTHDHNHDHTHDHDEDHEHHHSHTHDHDHSHDHDHDHDPDHEHSHDHDHDHHNHSADGRRYGYEEILELIRSLDLPDNVSANALKVYETLGEAEAAVHGVPLDGIHLHEVGSLDAVADIVGCCLLVNMLGVTEITASPVHVGAGSVKCEHGILPVPAPTTAEILKGVPICGGHIQGELCTPTGAALLKCFAGSFGDMPSMTVVKIGYGMGAKDFKAANCLRAFLCEDEASGAGSRETVCEISCNLDDMTPEAIGAAFGMLFENGALDVFTTPIMMKKNRPAVMLSCLCAEDERERLARLMLEHTSTLGVRISTCRRDVLKRTFEAVRTEYGDIQIKVARGFGTITYKPEYDDVLAAAKRSNVPFTTVYNAAIREAERK